MIVLLGAVLRLAAFDETLILEDQSAILDAAFQIAHLRYFPVTGMKSSVGVMQTSVIPLLAALPLFFVKRVIAVQWFFSALDVLAIAWLYRAMWRTFGRRAAALAALLYATSPWVVLYARTIWYQTLIATFATVAFAGVLLLLARRQRHGGVLALVMAGTTLMAMVHLAAAPWGVLLYGLYVVIAQRQRLWRAFWWGFGVSVAIVLPYVVYLVRTSFADVVFILKAGGESQGLNTAVYRLSQELVTGAMVVANAHGDLWDNSVVQWDGAYVIVLVALGAALVWAVSHIVTRRRSWPVLLFTVVWLVVVPTLFLLTGVHLQHFYLMMIFPAPFVLLGAWLEACLVPRGTTVIHKLRWSLGRVAAVALVLVALWWASLWVVRIRLEAQGLLERPTRGWLMDRTADVVAQYLQEEPDGQIVVLAQFEGIMSMFEWLRGYAQTDAVRVVRPTDGFLIPEGPVCYLLGPGSPVQVLSPVSRAVAERPAMKIPANPPWHFFCTTGPVARPAPLAVWENGMHLLDTEVTGEFRAGARLDIVHTWLYRVTQPAPYHFFNHLLRDGELIAQVDGGGIPHWYWRDGDLLLTRFSLQLPADLPPGAYVLRVGMYTWPEGRRILRVDGEDGYDAFVPEAP